MADAIGGTFVRWSPGGLAGRNLDRNISKFNGFVQNRLVASDLIHVFGRLQIRSHMAGKSPIPIIDSYRRMLAGHVSLEGIDLVLGYVAADTFTQPARSL